MSAGHPVTIVDSCDMHIWTHPRDKVGEYSKMSTSSNTAIIITSWNICVDNGHTCLSASLHESDIYSKKQRFALRLFCRLLTWRPIWIGFSAEGHFTNNDEYPDNFGPGRASIRKFVWWDDVPCVMRSVVECSDVLGGAAAASHPPCVARTHLFTFFFKFFTGKPTCVYLVILQECKSTKPPCAHLIRPHTLRDQWL